MLAMSSVPLASTFGVCSGDCSTAALPMLRTGPPFLSRDGVRLLSFRGFVERAGRGTLKRSMPYSQELLDDMIKAQDAFVWEAPSWERRNRGPRWYLIMSIVAIAFVIYAVATNNFLFAFLILLIAIVLVLAGNQEPENVLVQIGKNGVVVDGRLYEYKDLSNFAIIYHPPETKVLYLESNRIAIPRIRLFLNDQNPIHIRNHLKGYLDENLALQEEHLSDIVARLLKI